jgi:hypothetical protein
MNMTKNMVLERNQKRNALAASAMSRVSPKKARDEVPEMTSFHRATSAKLRRADKTVLMSKLGRLYGVVDKLMLVLPRDAFPESFLNEVAGRLLQSKSKNVKGSSRKSNAYRHMFVLTCPSGAKVVFGLVAAKQGMHNALQITLNPAQMDLPDTHAFYNVLKAAFMPDWKNVVRALLIQRVDQAYDYPVSMADLLVQGDGLLAEEKYYVRTDRGGHVQTWYCGSVESLLHFITYDQVASDA